MAKQADYDFRSASIVRQVDPEDVYDDHLRDRYNQMPPPTFSASTMRAQYTYAPPPRPISAASFTTSSSGTGGYHTSYERPGSRQISNTSSASGAGTNISGSENWETYDDGSEAGDETDAREAYYAKVHAQQQAAAKRGVPDGGYAVVQGKRVRGLGIGMNGRTIVEEEVGGQLVRVEGSDAGWTDEDGY